MNQYRIIKRNEKYIVQGLDYNQYQVQYRPISGTFAPIWRDLSSFNTLESARDYRKRHQHGLNENETFVE